MILAISKDADFELRSVTRSDQIFGVGVESLAPGAAAVIDADALGYPHASLADIPAGEYYVKAYLHLYETFRRADGHVVKLPMDRGEGQNWLRAPGNLFSEAQRIAFDPESDRRFSITLDRANPPVEPPLETGWVRNIEIESRLLSDFWGRPMKIAARVLLPRGYEDHPDRRYPLVIQHGHFDRRAPGRFSEPGQCERYLLPEGAACAAGVAFHDAWVSEDFPQMLLVTIQHATPYYDDSYAVNSENHGPYGDAITRELIPAVERAFRGIGAPYARVLTGGSTGGWEAIAQQIFYPDFFGGVWTFYPDQVDFHYYQLADLYAAENAYWREYEWLRVPLPGARDIDGRPRYTMRDENIFEEVIGTRYRSGGQWAAWNATFAPVAADGYPAPIWDPLTGAIDAETARWAIEHYDLVHILRENWSELGPKLAGKINVFVGRRDNFYLEQAAYLLEAFLAETENPHVPGRFEYGENGPHGWSPWRDRNDPGGMYREMADHIRAGAPAGADLRWAER
ncbi:MAG: alpha/beta hydrolase-fold protein [Parvularculaceae bacterium]